MNMFKKVTKLSLLPLIFMLTSCTVSPQQAFQNAKLTLVDEIKAHFLAKDESLVDIDYGEMQYILLNKTNSEMFPINRYYYTGKIILTTTGTIKSRSINPTTYYDLVTKKGGILDDGIESFKKLKEYVDAGGKYSGSQGTFFPSNY